jgi:uncharacterized protein
MDLELTLKERLLLANQYLILEKLYPEEASRYSQFREALRWGYSLHYSELVDWFSELGLSRDECRKVIEILNMYRALHAAYNESPDKNGVKADAVVFPGFDGNDESTYYGYVTYLINECGKWSEFAGHDFNTHTEMMPKYEQMLQEWERKTENRYKLTSEEMVRILDAGRKWSRAGGGGLMSSRSSDTEENRDKRRTVEGLGKTKETLH